MCRAFLSPWKDEDGNYKLYGRINLGVCSLNIPDVALTAKGNLDSFWSILEDRLEIVRQALMLRYDRFKNVTSDSSPIHYQHGAIARLKKGEKVQPLFKNGYATISLGYIGIKEAVYALIGQSHTTEEGQKLALDIMKKLRQAVDKWKEDTGLGFALYGAPSENLTSRFAQTTRKRFGVIEGVTDRDFLTNSYHVHVEEEIDAFSKFSFESQFHSISSGGAISYIEIPNMKNNIEAMLELIKFSYEEIQYSEYNTKLDACHICGFEGEILLDDDLKWYCPQCNNRDKDKMNVVRRTCGYLGENYWNKGRTAEIKNRVLHL